MKAFLRFVRPLCCVLLAGAASAADVALPPEWPNWLTAVAAFESGQTMEPLRKVERAALATAPGGTARATAESGLASILSGTSTFDGRKFACQVLGIIGSEASVPALSGLLKNPETVGIACVALSTLPSAAADDALLEALAASAGTVRLQLVMALGDRRSTKAVDALAPLARDADSALADAAAAALAKIATAPAQKMLRELLAAGKPSAPGSLLQLIETLRRDGQTEGVAELGAALLEPAMPAHVRRGALKALLATDPDGGEARVAQLVAGKDAVLKPVAIAAVSSLRGRGVSTKFGGMMEQLLPGEKVWMIEALAARGDAAGLRAIGQTLTASEEAVRSAAVAAIGSLGDESEVSLLAQALAKSTSAAESSAIATALVQLKGGRSTDKALVAALEDAASRAKLTLISVLTKRRATVAADALFDEVASADEAVVRAAVQALGRIGRVDDLSRMLKAIAALKGGAGSDEAIQAAMQLLGKEPDADRRTAMVNAAYVKADPTSRGAYLRLMPSCGTAAALETVGAAMATPDASLRDAGARALANWPDLSAWDSLLALYGQKDNDTHRVLALRGLARLASAADQAKAPALAGRYKALLDGATNDDDRKLILGAMASAASAEVLELAKALAQVPGIRPEAEAAIARISAALKAK